LSRRVLPQMSKWRVAHISWFSRCGTRPAPQSRGFELPRRKNSWRRARSHLSKTKIGGAPKVETCDPARAILRPRMWLSTGAPGISLKSKGIDFLHAFLYVQFNNDKMFHVEHYVDFAAVSGSLGTGRLRLRYPPAKALFHRSAAQVATADWRCCFPTPREESLLSLARWRERSRRRPH
jgi:hypothetical protein